VSASEWFDPDLLRKSDDAYLLTGYYQLRQFIAEQLERAEAHPDVDDVMSTAYGRAAALRVIASFARGTDTFLRRQLSRADGGA
jgi:aspartate/methionine/tyrosine aminotransferase